MASAVRLDDNQRILVTGGGTFLGDAIAAALLGEGATVTVLVRPGNEDRLGRLRDRVRWAVADVWDPASLRGRARGHGCVINTVGSMTAVPEQGLTFHRLNVVSARNVVNMCSSDGVAHAILMSAVSAPWIDRRYVRTKREAEEYVVRVGVDATIVRAPLAYKRGSDRPLFFTMMSAFGTVPPLSWTRLGRIAPTPVDVIARAVARIALDPNLRKPMMYTADLRRLNTRDELRREPVTGTTDDTQRRRPSLPIGTLDDDAPFGWTPRDDR